MNTKKFLQLSMIHSGTIFPLDKKAHKPGLNKQDGMFVPGLTTIADLSSLGQAFDRKTQVQLGTRVCFIGYLELLLSTKLSVNVRFFWIKYTQKYILQ